MPAVLLSPHTPSIFTTLKWAASHGAVDGHLGAGMLYYSFAYLGPAQIAVCLGSGGGFVPGLMRTAQHDSGAAQRGARTILVDASLPAAGWGQPDWLDPNSTFRTHFDCEIVVATTEEAARRWPADLPIDYLHIDADHTYDGCRRDVELYKPLLRPGGIMTLHDTGFHTLNTRCGVHRVVAELRDSGADVLDFPSVGAGVAVIRFQ